MRGDSNKRALWATGSDLNLNLVGGYIAKFYIRKLINMYTEYLYT